MRFCTDCGTPRHAAEAFCTACGRRFEDAPPHDELAGYGAPRFAPHLVAVWVVALLAVGALTTAIVVAANSGGPSLADRAMSRIGLRGGGAATPDTGAFGGGSSLAPDADSGGFESPSDEPSDEPSDGPSDEPSSPPYDDPFGTPSDSPPYDEPSTPDEEPTPAEPTEATPTFPTSLGTESVGFDPDSAPDPRAAQIQLALTTYFQAINTRDYDLYNSIHTPDAQVLTRDEFAKGFRSTEDTAASVTGIQTGVDGQPVASVTFTSSQNAEDGPDGQTCTHWQVRFFFQPGGGGYVIGTSPADYHAAWQAC